MSEESWSYAKAGVDIAKQRRLHERALSAAKTLSKRLNVEVEGLGGYSASVKLDAYKLMLHIDGVGTKTIVLRELKSLWVAGWDCVAVNVNDVACERGRPIAIVDYVSMPDTNEEEFSQIIEGLTRAAERSRTIIVGGETAILPDLVSGIDVVCAVLAIKEGDLKDPSEGDVLVGIESNGLHANGYTLVRRVLKNKGLSYNSSISGVYFSSELTKPTAIYSNMLLEAFEKGLIKRAAHITGGGFSKLKRVLNSSFDARIDAPRPPSIFEVIQELGRISTEEMYKVFNMGIGMIVITEREALDDLIGLAERHGLKASSIGVLEKGIGRVLIKTWRGEKIEI